VEAQFGRRVAYTMVIPRPNLALYAGDWILWFAELDQQPSEAGRIRPPVPVRKFESLGAAANVSFEPDRATRVLFAGIIQRDGKLTGIEVMAKISPALGKALAEDLGRWEFRPATKNGAPIDVEAVLEIPFRNPASSESGAESGLRE
jgi:hypothetical protein